MTDENLIDPFGVGKNLPAPIENEDQFDEDDWDSAGRPKLLFKLLSIVGVLSLSVGAFFLGSYVSKSENPTGISSPSDDSSDGIGALTETQLRDLVVSSKVAAYWAGPIRGYKYAFFMPKKGVVVIRYLPDGKGFEDSSPNYRVIGTYVQKDATKSVISGGKKSGSLGFTNIDGNSVFYVRARPTNVYMAIKNQDIQIEIFDPGQDQAVALSLFKGQIQQIK